MASLLKRICCCCFKCSDDNKKEEEEKIIEDSPKKTKVIPILKKLPTVFEIPPISVSVKDDAAESKGLAMPESSSGRISPIDISDLDINLYLGDVANSKDIYPPDNIGRLWYSLLYSSNEQQLTITMKEVKNLLVDYNSGPKKVFYIRIHLLPGQSRYYNSKKKWLHAEVEFEDSFTFFQLPKTQIDDCSLEFTIYSGSRELPSDDLFDETSRACVPFSKLDLANNNSSSTHDGWIDFTPSDSSLLQPNSGKILLSLYYDAAKQRLLVIVFKCVQLKLRQLKNVLLKIELATNNKVLKKCKSLKVKECIDEAEFNEMFKFYLNPLKLQFSSISIIVKTPKSSDQQKGVILGRVTLGGALLATGKERSHWQAMINTKDKQHTYWHSLSSSTSPLLKKNVPSH